MESQGLVENFKTFILKKYQEQSSVNDEMKILFEAIGHPISEKDITDEMFSTLVNIYPNSEEDIFKKHLQKLDTIYQNILNGSKLINNKNDDSFIKMKSEAINLLERYNVAGDTIIADTYLKSDAIPNNWFSDNKYWFKYNPVKLKNDLALKIVGNELKATTKSINEKINMSRTQNVINLKPTTETTDISLEYCIVEIDRKWMTASLFTYYKDWYISNKIKGELANSPFDFQYIPTAIIVIKNLNIQADWSSTDSNQISKSASIGPFSLKGSKWLPKKGLIVNEKTQIIGWICSKIPALPPKSDPKLHPGGYIKIDHAGWYVAKFNVSWEEQNSSSEWINKTWDSGNKTKGYTYKLYLPQNVKNVKVTGWANTGLVWDPWNQIMCISEFETPNKTYKVTGTTLNNECVVIDS